MRRGRICVMISVLIVFSLITIAQAAWWDSLGTPEYGGNLRQFMINEPHFDAHDPRGLLAHQYDGLAFYDWSTNPNIRPHKNEFIEEEYLTGYLAESWEQTDPLTVIVHLRKGVHWQDKPPVNGREFTADDVVYNYNRVLGIGSGFTEPNPFNANKLADIKQVTALDKYTVQFKLKQSTVWSIYQVLGVSCSNDMLGMVAKEWVDQGDLENWKNTVGTGPFMLTNYVASVSEEFTRNPNYWSHDERYPDNQLPYLDKLRFINVTDAVTQLAALRTGKIDLISARDIYLSWMQLEALKKSNPEIQSGSFPVDGYSIDLRIENKPFDDIRVRKALQLAINRKEIAEGYYGGTLDPTPAGLINPTSEEWIIPYEDWPIDLQEEYAYNPEKAKGLLAEAGYSDGFDTHCVLSTDTDIRVAEIIKSQFMDIGVNMELEAMEKPTFMNYCQSGKNDQMVFWTTCAIAWAPLTDIGYRTPGEWKNMAHVDDAVYNEIYAKFISARTLDEAKELAKKADMYALSQHWSVNLFSGQSNAVWQPYLKGYTGFNMLSGSPLYARLWMNQALMKSIKK